MYRKVLYSSLFSSTYPSMIFFFFIEIASMHNFSDDNTLPAWRETLSKLIGTLESKSNIAIDWFKKKTK